MGIDAETYAAAKGYTDHAIEGGGGTLDYEVLRNHPSINGNELTGNKSSKQLGITNLWTGTTAEWAQLTADQKAQYTHVCFTDDTAQELVVVANPEAEATAELTKLQVGQSVYSVPSGAKVDANASAIEAIIGVNGSCNVFAIDNPTSLSDVSVANYGIVNTDVDSKTVFNCWVATFNSSGQQIQGIFTQNIDTTGHKELNITIPDNNYYSLQLRHNGSVRDLAINVPAVPAGDYKLSFDVVGYNPSTVGGLEIRNIMLYDARLNPTGYVKYAKTNVELTKHSIVKRANFINAIGEFVLSDALPSREAVMHAFLVVYGGYYPGNDSGAWIVVQSPINAQDFVLELAEHNVDMAYAPATNIMTFNQTSGNADTVEIIIFRLY